MNIVAPDQAGIRQAADAIAAGELVVFPTDTVHGLACRPADTAALDRLFEVKGRPPDRRVATLVASVGQLPDLGISPAGVAQTLADAFWPGGLTLILPTADGGTLGVRAPDHPTAVALLALTGPLPTTSANPHGSPECLTTDDVLVAFAGSDGIGMLIRGDSPGGTASTVLDLTGDRPRLLREGAVSRDELSAVVGPID